MRKAAMPLCASDLVLRFAQVIWCCASRKCSSAALRANALVLRCAIMVKLRAKRQNGRHLSFGENAGRTFGLNHLHEKAN